MKKLIVFSVLLLILYLVPLQLTAQPEHKGDGPRHQEMMDQLNLTDQQEEQISKIRSEHKLKMIDSRAEIAKLEVQLNEEKQKKVLDENQILSLTKKIGDLRSGLQTSSTEMWLKVYNLLDEKQKELWKEKQPRKMMRREMRNKMMEHERERKDNQ